MISITQPELKFGFGQNWQRFLSLVNEERIVGAERSLSEMLGRTSLRGASFLDVGCGSGLFSLAARRLDARVYSFDADPNSVQCTRTLRARFFPDDKQWWIADGSILDPEFTRTLPPSDVVYAWGVLHHTGALWTALDVTCRLTAPHGSLFTAIYNDQGAASRRWAAIKRTYNHAHAFVRPGIVLGVGAYLGARRMARSLTTLATPPMKLPPSPRGMSRWHDLVDWVGGYPFEVSTPEQVFDFVAARGFILEKLVTRGGGLGCNEFVFRRT